MKQQTHPLEGKKIESQPIFLKTMKYKWKSSVKMQNGIVCWPMFGGTWNRTAFLRTTLH